MNRILDISLSIGPDLLVWPGDPPVEVVPRSQIAKGDPANVSEVRMGTHTGTHVDPPVHFVPGDIGIDRVPVEGVVGPATVADLRGVPGPLGPEQFERLPLPDGVTRLLLRTDNSELWRSERPAFPEKYVALSPSGARWVVERGIRLIGIDFLSIEQRGAEGHPVHHHLLANGVVIVEGLDLGGVAPGEYDFACLPLKVHDGDGGPARAVLIEKVKGRSGWTTT